MIEGFANCFLTFGLGSLSSALTISGQSTFAIALYAALGNWVGLSLFILSAAPVSGGHLNPTITMATFFAGLSTFPRSVLYIAGQCIGAIVGAYWLRLGLGDSYFSTGAIPGCTIDPKLVSVGEMWVLEYMFSLVLLFIAFGVGLDPRQAKVFGAALAPILVGSSLALGTLASTFAKPGWLGICKSTLR